MKICTEALVKKIIMKMKVIGNGFCWGFFVLFCFYRFGHHGQQDTSGIPGFQTLVALLLNLHLADKRKTNGE